MHMENYEKAKSKLLNILNKLRNNTVQTEMERVEIAAFSDFFSSKPLSSGVINQIIRIRPIAMMYRDNLIYDLRTIMVDEVLIEILNIISGAEGLAIEGTSHIIENAGSDIVKYGKYLKALGTAGQVFSTGKTLKTMSDIFKPIEAIISDPYTFDMWRVKLETKMVHRIKRAG